MGKLIEDGLRRCLCGHWITVKAGAGICAHCGRTIEQVREHHRQENHARAMDRGTLLALNARRCERRKELSRMVAECKRIDHERGSDKPHEKAKWARPSVVAQLPDKPLNAPRLCPGGPWNHGKCGHKAAYESRWCAKCQAARRAYYGLEWSPNDPAQCFAGGEVEHEVAI